MDFPGGIKMAKEAKTNAMRILERQKIPYQVLTLNICPSKKSPLK